MLSALATFLVLAGLTPIAPTHEIVVTLLAANAATVALLLAVIIREGMALWMARKRGRAGARLHIRVVSLFSVIAALPAILVAVVASITLDRGLDRWFSERTKLIVETSVGVGQAYVREHAGSIRSEILAMAQDFNRLHPIFDSDRDALPPDHDRAGDAARPAGRHDDQARPQRRRAGQHPGQPATS